MKVVQVLPELNAGGVERGTVEFARWLIAKGHQATVISHGGSLVPQLQSQGCEYIHFPVHKKSLWSLRHIRPLRQLLLSLDADIIHVRSRLPAWLVWLAIGRLPRAQRPALVSTFHGLYSRNRYSEIMGCGDRVIAISQCVYDYILQSYPRIDKDKISIIHRGVDEGVFSQSDPQSDPQTRTWREALFRDYPQLKDKPIILMPGRITPWKGHSDFLAIIHQLKQQGIDCHGVIAGAAAPSKQHYEQQLKNECLALGLDQHISFIGHRNDIHQLYQLARVVCNLSQHPEPFGRTVIEALALGTPVVAYNVGGPAESLRSCFPEGLAPEQDQQAVLAIIKNVLHTTPTILLPEEFTLNRQAAKTLAVYQQALRG